MNQKGFTLVEAIIAMAIMGVIAVTFIPLLTAQYVNIQRTGDQSDATYAAVARAEDSVIKLKDAKNDTEKQEAKKEIEKNGGEVDDSNDDSNKVKIPVLNVDEEVTTIKIKGKDKRDSEETDLVVGVPKKN